MRRNLKGIFIILLFVLFPLFNVLSEQKVLIFDPETVRDPFRPFIKREEPIRPKGVIESPLLQYELNQLKLVAIIVGGNEDRAMVEDSEGKGYIIRVGDYIGNRFGRVKQIRRDAVIIEEVYKDIVGRIRTKEIILYLHPQEKGEKKS
jgi:type IV pilus assembly protein PilP